MLKLDGNPISLESSVLLVLVLTATLIGNISPTALIASAIIANVSPATIDAPLSLSSKCIDEPATRILNLNTVTLEPLVGNMYVGQQRPHPPP